MVGEAEACIVYTLTHQVNEAFPIQSLLHADATIMDVTNFILSTLANDLHVLLASHHDIRTVIDSLVVELEEAFVILLNSRALKVAILDDLKMVLGHKPSRSLLLVVVKALRAEGGLFS